jgi:amidase
VGPEVARAPHLVSRHFRSQVATGAAISEADYKAALAERSRLVEAVREWAAACDAILTPPAPGEAPGLETTGDPRLCARWSLVGAPAISVLAGRGPGRLPLGLQLCGAPSEDRALLGAAAWVERALAENHG